MLHLIVFWNLGLNNFSILATILSIVGNFGVVHKKIWGLIVWIYVAIFIHKDYAQLLLFIFYLVMNTYTIYVWKKDERLSKIEDII